MENNKLMHEIDRKTGLLTPFEINELYQLIEDVACRFAVWSFDNFERFSKVEDGKYKPAPIKEIFQYFINHIYKP